MAKKDKLGDLIGQAFKEDAEHVKPPKSWDEIKDDIFKRAAEGKTTEAPSVGEMAEPDEIPRDDAIGNMIGDAFRDEASKVTPPPGLWEKIQSAMNERTADDTVGAEEPGEVGDDIPRDDALGNMISDTFKKDAAEHAPPAGLRENINRMVAEHSLHDAPAGNAELQASNDLSIANNLSREVHGNSVLEATVKTGAAATRLHSISEATGKDMLAVTSGNVLLASGHSKAIESTCQKFAEQRCDVSLSDGSVVNGITPREGQSMGALANEVKSEYSRQSAIEQCQGLGMKSFQEYNGITVTQGSADLSNASQIHGEMSAEFSNVCTAYRNEELDCFECVMDEKSELGQIMAGVHDNAIVPSNRPGQTTFRFETAEELQAFLEDARNTSRMIANDKDAGLRKTVNELDVKEYDGIKIAKAHELSQEDAVKAQAMLSTNRKDTLVTHTNGDKTEVMVDANSPLGKALAQKYGDQMQLAGNNPNVAVFTFDSKADAAAFCNDANDMAHEVGREEISTDDGFEIDD